jgi:hypothetical protein
VIWKRGGGGHDAVQSTLKIGTYRVTGHAGDLRLRVLVDNAVLDVEAADLDKRAGRRASVGNELGDDGDLLGGVDSLARPKEGGIAHAVRVKIAPVLVTHP